MVAPICLFTYNRLAETKLTVEALSHNYLAAQSTLFIFSDGPKNANSKKDVEEVRKYIRLISGFKTVTIIESAENKGLASSIISGVTEIINKYGKVIVLEDDLISTPNFLNFMNQALDYYELNANIYNISGCTLALKSLNNYFDDFFIAYRAFSWGWATWKDRWNEIDWEVSDYEEFKLNRKLRADFNKNRGSDMFNMLQNQMNGKIDSWAIRWCYNQFKKQRFTVFPSKSKIMNIGFDNYATNTRNQNNRYPIILDNSNQSKFIFSNVLNVNNKIIRDFYSYYSIANRVIWKVRSVIRNLKSI